MACGSCGGRKSDTEYEVTFRDGSKKRVATAGEARIAARSDTTEGNRVPTFKAVPKIAN
jgi:hypothetical protein